ncbi:MAG: protease pro-enzyme activation domain-containing protein [Bryobacteraceae bacterium]
MIPCFSLATLYAQQDRIATRIDDSRTVALPGHIHPKAQPRYDQGVVEATLQLPSITIHIKPSTGQQQSLSRLLSDQQNPSSPQYRKWLTPEQYGDQFGASSNDMGKIEAWLQSQGFAVQLTARSRTWITFSGTAQQVQNGLHAEIHRYNVNGEIHYANATNPAIPAAFASMVNSIRGLNDFRLKPRNLRKVSPKTTSENGTHHVAPDDFAAIYDVAPLYSAGIDGAGQSLVIVGQTQIIPSDITTFRSQFHLPAINLQQVLVPGQQNPGVQVQSGDLGESDLDIEWSGAVARNATIIFVYSPDVFTSFFYAVDQDYAPVISISYGDCESSDLVDLPTYQSAAQQANAEGVTWMAAAGDSGAADCEDSGAVVAQDGLAVDAPGSIPEVTSVGGTEFNEQGGTYWSGTNTANDASALSYIPEMVWNDMIVDRTIAAGGGGASLVFFKPVWQAGTGVPNDGARDVPDVAFNASDAHDNSYFYSYGSGGYAGGTSLGAPTMSGIVTLLNQYLVSTGIQSQPGLGNINPMIYRLAQNSPGVFHDVTTGNNAVACVVGSPNCASGTLGYNAVPYYDLASGWGSLDVYNFVHQWSNAAPTNSAVVVSVSQSTGPGIYGNTDVVFEQPANSWNFTLTLTEEAGVPTTLSGMTIDGTDYSSQFATLFGSASIPANRSISAQIGLSNLNVPANVAFTFSGVDVSGRQWSQQLSVPFQGPEAQVAIGGISNAASGQQVFAPGEIISVYGTALGDFVQSAGTLPLTMYLAGFEAAVNNNPAYLYYVSPNQVNLQIPYETPAGPATLTVGNPYANVTYNFEVSFAAPGIFVTPDGLVNPSSSGTANQVLSLYVTGAGQLRPAIPDGEAPANDNSKPAQAVSLAVGGVAAQTTYVGVPTWSVGVLQINFVVPATVAAGKQPVVVTVGGVASQAAYINIAP